MQEFNESKLQNSDSPIFLRKVFHLIEICPDTLVSWSKDGTSFTIKDHNEFSNQILPQYFKHNNFSSFVRQLNCYGFTKAKDDSNNPVVNEDGRLWTFHHPDFIRGQPQLLSKIQRKSSSHTTKEDSKKDSIATLGVCTSTSSSSSEMDQERKELEKEITTLKGQLHNMEDIFQELAQKMATVTMSHTSNTSTSTARTLTSHTSTNTFLLKHKKKIKLEKPSSAKILLNDKQLFDSKSSSTVFQTKVQSKHPLSIAKLMHNASIDLPDLGKIGTNDSDLYAGAKPCINDQKRTSPTNELQTFNDPIDVSDSILEESFNPLHDVDMSMECALSYKVSCNTKDFEENDLQTMEDDTVKSQPTKITCSPILIQDDCEEDKPSQCSSFESDSQSVPTTSSLDNLLDTEHLQNLESALRSLPMKERMSFVRDVLSNIPDISSQGVSVLILTEQERTILTEQRHPECENISLLSQMENLLGRVGLKIQLGGQEQSNSTSSCSRSLRSSQKKKKSSSKDSSYVQIEA